MDETEGKQEFVVRDKRRFSPEAEAEVETEPINDQEPEGPSQAAAEAGPTEEEPRESERTEQRQALPVDFSSFVLSMANSALYHMGFLTFQDAEPKKDLPAARQTIDLLALFEEKTKGNLTEQEQKILKETLFQLRMAFVEATK
jgi:hypothetical protein